MSYLVLARKYRPRTLQEVVGQEHVVQGLTNALQQGRVHHAYLFTGTRGVGKTSLARLLAKCLNCEQGLTATPCNECPNCREVSEGRFIDLIEIDAASRTKVEDTRELLDNVPYAPNRGRYKVYLIDEVHMLSGHSFNALLKTLEEPPSHVKFLLATTDPQRLPVTILSRCLQFNLKNLSIEQIAQHIQYILQQEQITGEETAVRLLAQAAKGSLRDALSLLDQAIAYGNGHLLETDIRSLLGSVAPQYLLAILTALQQQQAEALFTAVQQLAKHTFDFANVLEDLIELLHQIALLQVLPETASNHPELGAELTNFAQLFSPEDIQLLYQIALIGRRDLSLAPNPQTGFEMILLRMLVFRPISTQLPHTIPKPEVRIPAALPKGTSSNKAVGENKVAADYTPPPHGASAPNNAASLPIDWPQLVEKLNLNGFTHALATNCSLQNHANGQFHLLLDPNQAALNNPKQAARLTEALTAHLGYPVKIQIALAKGEIIANTPALLQQQAKQEQVAQFQQELANDPKVQTIMQLFDATILPDSIRPNSPEAITKT